MVFELKYIVNGFYPILIGVFENVHEAVHFLKEYVRVNSAITNPRYSKSWSNNQIRIDYGARDCYFVIELEIEEIT